MGIVSVSESLMFCSEGEIPAALAIDFPPIFIDGLMVGQILDIIPQANIGGFGVCQVLLSTTGLPIPCIFIPSTPWIPEDPAIFVDGIPILSAPNELVCAIGGDITLFFPNQVGVLAL